jgi:integrase
MDRARRHASHLFFVSQSSTWQWKEFDFEKAEWVIPEMKMRQPHRVPLTANALILKELKAITGRGHWLFPSVSSVCARWRRLNIAVDLATTDTMSAFRAMAATRLNESADGSDAIEPAYAPRANAIRRATPEYRHWSEMR